MARVKKTTRTRRVPRKARALREKAPREEKVTGGGRVVLSVNEILVQVGKYKGLNVTLVPDKPIRIVLLGMKGGLVKPAVFAKAMKSIHGPLVEAMGGIGREDEQVEETEEEDTEGEEVEDEEEDVEDEDTEDEEEEDDEDESEEGEEDEEDEEEKPKKKTRPVKTTAAKKTAKKTTKKKASEDDDEDFDLEGLLEEDEE